MLEVQYQIYRVLLFYLTLKAWNNISIEFWLSLTNLDMSENRIFKGKSILFGSPVFFSFEAAIKNKLIELGADVTYVDDRPSNNSFFKGVIRVYKKILDDPILKYYARVTNDVADFPGLWITF